MAHPAHAVGTSLVQSVRRALLHIAEAPPCCPVCFHAASEKILERFHSYTLHECSPCRLQFWEPRKLPDAHGPSSASGAADQRLVPLDPGHCFFLADQLAPRCGRLLDVGCGTGNFLIAASLAGYAVSGVEPNAAAARLAASYCPRARVFPLRLESLRRQCPNETFDILTSFEVLQQQADPSAFLAAVRKCLRPRGFIALSVPNRDRWQISRDESDHPPSHFLRWNPDSLLAALKTHGFSVMSVRQQRVSLPYAAQQIKGKLRFGVSPGPSAELPPETSGSSRDEVDDTLQDLDVKAISDQPAFYSRALPLFSRLKYATCLPLAAAYLPFVRHKGHVGPHLYCLARKLD